MRGDHILSPLVPVIRLVHIHTGDVKLHGKTVLVTSERKMSLMLKLLKLNLQFFADETPAGSAPDNAGTTPDETPAPKVYNEAYVKQLREEAAGYRTRAKAAETKAETQQKEVLTKVFGALGINPDPNLEFEKQLSDAQLQAQAAEKRANERLIKAEVKSIGAELGIVDVDIAYMLADKESFEVKDDGSVSGVAEALKKVVEAKPFLVAESKKGSGYFPGSDQKGNPPKEPDPYQAARERARKKLRK